MIKIKKAFLRLTFRSVKGDDLQQRIFGYMLSLFLYVPIASIIGNAVVGYRFQQDIKWILSILLSGFCAYKMDDDTWFSRCKFIFISYIYIGMLTIPWFFAGCDSLLNLLYFLLMLVASLLMFEKPAQKKFCIAITLIVPVCLMYIEGTYPQLIYVDPYANQMLDRMVTFFLITLALSIVMFAYTREYENQHEVLYKLSCTDQLLNILNRKSVLDYAEEVKNKETTRNHYIAIIDLDNFKTVNDTYGHQAGDSVLKQVANAIQHIIFPKGTLGRYGGDEFLVVLQSMEEKEIRTIIEQLSRLVVSYNNITITVSGGIVQLYKGQDIDTAIAEADELMYLAKSEGKAKVLYGEENLWQTLM